MGELSCRMFSLALLCAFVAVSVTGAHPHHPLLSSEMVNFINKVNTTWTVSRPSEAIAVITSPPDSFSF